MEARLGVDTASRLVGGEADVHDHSALQGKQKDMSIAVWVPAQPRSGYQVSGHTHLIQVLTVGAVAQEAHRAAAARPGAVGEAVALSSREAGIG